MRESRIFYIGFSDNDLPMIYVGSVDKQKKKGTQNGILSKLRRSTERQRQFLSELRLCRKRQLQPKRFFGLEHRKNGRNGRGNGGGGLAAEPSDAQTLQTSDDALSQRSERSYGRPQRWAYGRTHGRSQRRTRWSRTGRPQIKNTQSRDQSVSALVVYLKTAGCRRAVLTYNC